VLDATADLSGDDGACIAYDSGSYLWVYLDSDTVTVESDATDTSDVCSAGDDTVADGTCFAISGNGESFSVEANDSTDSAATISFYALALIALVFAALF